MSSEDSLESFLSATEDLKSGFITSVMYGEYKTLIMDPPHLFIFSNQQCPRKSLSDERWRIFRINKDKKFLSI
jgi:hypothetical protein